eukprot:2799097-Rhodomonas_salina.1
MKWEYGRVPSSLLLCEWTIGCVCRSRIVGYGSVLAASSAVLNGIRSQGMGVGEKVVSGGAQAVSVG